MYNGLINFCFYNSLFGSLFSFLVKILSLLLCFASFSFVLQKNCGVLLLVDIEMYGLF